MERRANGKRLLFIHADRNGSAAHRSIRSKSMDSEVRRHLMLDIGKSRRKPAKEVSFETLVWSLSQDSDAQSLPSKSDRLKDKADGGLQVVAKDFMLPPIATQYFGPHLMASPILHELSVFEKQWGEDMFSAYGFSLIVATGRNAMESGNSTNICWFPFAFRKSAFLHHYQAIFDSPDALIPLYRGSFKELRSLALERSLETIQCVEHRLASSDLDVATSDAVLQAVLAMICYNLTSGDFAQAMIHVKGLFMVIATRGGIANLTVDQDLMLMISWVDITAALLHNTKPLFHLFPSTISPSASSSASTGMEMLPPPLRGLFYDETIHDGRLISVLATFKDLNVLVGLIRADTATDSRALRIDEEMMASFVNPVAYRLLSQPSSSVPMTHCDHISEALRIGAIIWIILVKRKYRSYPGTAGGRVSAVLKILLSKSNMGHVWNEPHLRIIRLWLLVLCSISEPSDKDFSILMRTLIGELAQRRSSTWIGVMADVRQMPWLNTFELPCAQIGQQLSQMMQATNLCDQSNAAEPDDTY